MTSQSEKKQGITLKQLKSQKVLILLSIPFIIYVIIFCYVPLGGWLMAFQNYKPKNGLLHSEFVGLAKFEFLFSNDQFLKVIRNTLAMGVINLVLGTVTAILFAILLSEFRFNRGKKLVQTISYLPHFLSWVIVTGIVFDVLSTENGIVNEILVNLHIIDKPFNFLADPKWFWWIVGFANVWKETGWNSIIYLAAITSISPDLYEAASIDGAGHMTIFIKIIFPLCMPVIATVALFTAVGQWNSWFDAMLYNRMSDNLTTLQYELMKLLSAVTTSGKGQTAQTMEHASGMVTPTSVRAAATVITSLPIICLYPFLQKYFVAGLTIGGVKE